MPLTDMEIRTAKPGPRLAKLSDGSGLQLWIMPDGAKRWRLAYRLAGVQKVLAVGVYPATGLREARDEAKKLLAIGQDPSLAKKLAKLSKAVASANSFDAIAAELLEKKHREQKADRTIAKFEWFMSLARPAIGARPIVEITSLEILAVLRPIEARGRLETAKKLRGAIGQVFRFAIATGRAESDPTGALKGALASPTVKHRAAIIEPKERVMALRRLRISRAASAGLSAPASSSRKRRFAAASPAPISINSSAKRSAPSASRFFALSAFFTTPRLCLQKIPRLRPHASSKTSGNRAEAPSMAPVSR